MFFASVASTGLRYRASPLFATHTRGFNNQAAVQGVEHVVRAFEVEEERIEVWQQEAALEKRGTTVTIKDIGIGNEQRGCEG